LETEGSGSETEDGFWKRKAVEVKRKTDFRNGRRFLETEGGGSETEGGGSETEDGFWKRKTVEVKRKTVFENGRRWK